jgi:hypothetical protein
MRFETVTMGKDLKYGKSWWKKVPIKYIITPKLKSICDHEGLTSY